MISNVYPKFRQVHLYGGLVVLVPLIVLAATGILLNHAERLGLKPPKYGQCPDMDTAERIAAEFVASPKAWEEHTAQVERALEAATKQWGQVPLEHVQIKNERGCGLVVKIKARGQLPAGPERELVWSVSEQRVLAGAGGRNWLVELHTGRVLSSRLGFIWSDLAAGTLLVLSVTGLVLYLIPILRKRRKNLGLPRKAAGK